MDCTWQFFKCGTQLHPFFKMASYAVTLFKAISDKFMMYPACIYVLMQGHICFPSGQLFPLPGRNKNLSCSKARRNHLHGLDPTKFQDIKKTLPTKKTKSRSGFEALQLFPHYCYRHPGTEVPFSQRRDYLIFLTTCEGKAGRKTAQEWMAEITVWYREFFQTNASFMLKAEIPLSSVKATAKSCPKEHQSLC